MNDPDRQIRLWLQAELKKRGHGAKVALAAHLKVRPDAITRMLNASGRKESRDIRAHELLAMQEFFGENVLDLAAPPAPVVPLISWVSAGQMMQEHFAADTREMLRAPEIPKGDWIALQVQGDSMDRISPPDSIIFVNRKDRKLVPNACYVIADEDGNATYKRYRPGPTRFEPVSTNPTHEPIFPDNEPKIVGRVGLSMIRM
ncbi:LexA family transcriptional regulator [Parvibaculum sp.]|uniref:LexA family protein n=1 Tax=Parvibaculum sp. TaxID=2024848 RepID=UPI002733F6AF|nr:S24 family peptidase [Parvibaculum sp.]MDP3327715.1 S24 family peptidase [Parvibaculum sp.]